MRDDYNEICNVLSMGTDYDVYFDNFEYHMSDGTFDVMLGYGDDDFETLLSASNIAAWQIKWCAMDLET